MKTALLNKWLRLSRIVRGVMIIGITAVLFATTFTIKYPDRVSSVVKSRPLAKLIVEAGQDIFLIGVIGVVVVGLVVAVVRARRRR
jgi:hypothetical protein